MGAQTPDGTGLYFSWGNTDGHPNGGGYDFSQANYDETPGASVSANLTAENDAASVLLGGSWRIPTRQEYNELITNCSHIWTSLNGISGVLFTSNVNGNTLFMPAAGVFRGLQRSGYNSYALFWTASYYSAGASYNFAGSSASTSSQESDSRKDGMPIRAVRPGLV